jgi:hypothetical protein
MEAEQLREMTGYMDTALVERVLQPPPAQRALIHERSNRMFLWPED